MMKNIFNGNIKKEFIGLVKFSLIFETIIFLSCFILFFLVALLNKTLDLDEKICLYIVSLISLIAAVLYPLLTIYAVRTYPKHPKLAKGLLKEYVYVDKK